VSPILRPLSFLWTAAFWLVLGLALGLAAATTLPSVFGYRSFNILTGSMEPSIGVGAVVVDQPIKPTQARPGQVITFPDPSNHGRLLTHRLQRISLRGGTVYAVTKGDANDTVERWHVPAREDIGRVAFVAPGVGYARQWAAGMGGRLAALTALVLWGLSAIWDIWRSDPEDESEGEPEPDGSASPA
jgi:signal peptidase I